MKLQKPNRKQGIIGGGAAIFALSLPYFIHVDHHHTWDSIPGFYGLYGGIGCALIVIISKALGAAFLQKPEDWYE